MTDFTLFLSCIYCVRTSHFTAFHRSYINQYTQTHQNLSSKTKDICIPHMFIIKSWFYFQKQKPTTIKGNSLVLDSSKIPNIFSSTSTFVIH